MGNGYPRSCNNCGNTIYLHHDGDNVWRPYESWIAGNAAEGEWILHQCSDALNVEHSDIARQQIQVILARYLNSENFPPATPIAEDLNEPSQPERIEQKVYRILRDTALARKVKVAHLYKCQLCGNSLELCDGIPYAEAHHVKPLGTPHNGPDIERNIVCVCPNCHVLLDFGVIQLDALHLESVDNEYIDYHNTNIYGKRHA